MFDSLFFQTIWPNSNLAWYICAIALLFCLLNIVMRILEMRAIGKHYSWESEKRERYERGDEGVSLIITVNNDREAIVNNLPRFLEQDYPNFEVVVVDEVSDDDSLEELKRLAQIYPNLHISRLYEGVKFHRTKKIAINIGIMAAQNDILLFSDIDCVPATRNYIREMQACFSPSTVAVIGGSIFAYERGLKINSYRYIHNIHLLKYFLLKFFGVVVGCDPANYAYRRSMYLEERGFTRNNQELMGYESEMLLKFKKRGEIRVNRSPDSFISYPVGTDNRRESIEYYYAGRRSWPTSCRLLVNIAQWLHLLLYISLISLFFLAFPYWVITSAIVGVFLIDLIMVNLEMRRLGERRIFGISLLSNLVGFFAQWRFEVRAIFTARRWR